MRTTQETFTRFIRKALPPALVCLLLLLLVSCNDASTSGPHTEAEGHTMGTTWKILAVLPPDIKASQLQLLQARLDELEAIFTNWRPESPLSRFNQSTSTDWQAVPRELAEVVTQAQEISRETDGAFDVTLGPLVDLWGFGAAGRRDAPPNAAEIATEQARCGWQKLEVKLSPPMLRKSQGDLQLNVSALVEGYAADDCAARLRALHIENFLLDVGGELLAHGTKADGTPWQAGIQHPGEAKGAAVIRVPLNGQALSTSGTYRQYFESGGHRYAHVLDGRTGCPVTHRVVSVSVIADTCFKADSWSTALLALGSEKGRPLAKKLGLHAFFMEEGS